ncbi:MAG: hypothetical protein ACFCU4_01000 [Puniceicoccaceae bacterium]
MKIFAAFTCGLAAFFLYVLFGYQTGSGWGSYDPREILAAMPCLGILSSMLIILSSLLLARSLCSGREEAAVHRPEL